MKDKNLFTILFILVLTYILFHWETLRVNMIVFLTLRRGILSQNCFWWKFNDIFRDSTGAEIYQSLKKQGRFVHLPIFGTQFYLLTSLHDIQELLELSPNPFGPGKFKKQFFDSFMPKNVGISTNPDWKYKREFNDKVLQTDKEHEYTAYFFQYIQEIFYKTHPQNFQEFTELTRKLTSKIIFGTYEYNGIVYKIFKQADSFFSAVFNIDSVNKEDLEEYNKYLYDEIQNPKPHTLLALANTYHGILPMDVVLQQIPHWIFPVAGLFSVHLPRLLVLLANHKEHLEIVNASIKEKTYFEKDSYVRKCILELFRLNNAVNSTFRGLTQPFQFQDSTQEFPSGTQFVFFNNSVLRDLFELPNEFHPQRWTSEMETSFRALMFNQANQKCPGKELTISLLTMGLVTFLEMNKFQLETTIKLNPSFIPYLINPCTIEFISPR